MPVFLGICNIISIQSSWESLYKLWYPTHLVGRTLLEWRHIPCLQKWWSCGFVAFLPSRGPNSSLYGPKGVKIGPPAKNFADRFFGGLFLFLSWIKTSSRIPDRRLNFPHQLPIYSASFTISSLTVGEDWQEWFTVVGHLCLVGTKREFLRWIRWENTKINRKQPVFSEINLYLS